MVAGTKAGSVCVQAFGEYSWTAVNAKDVVSLPEGVTRGLHSRQSKTFQRGIFEVLAYLQVVQYLNHEGAN
jgi:hypothetical protein